MTQQVVSPGMEPEDFPMGEIVLLLTDERVFGRSRHPTALSPRKKVSQLGKTDSHNAKQRVKALRASRDFSRAACTARGSEAAPGA